MFLCNIEHKFDCDFKMKHVNLLKWRIASDLDKRAYTICTNEKLSYICIPIKALLCRQSTSNCTTHCKDIDLFYNSIVSALKHLSQIVYLHVCQILLKNCFFAHLGGTSM